MLPAHSHKNLIVYHKAKALAVDIIKYFASEKLNRAEEILVNQLIRAVGSIGANIAEGYGRHYSQEYRRFISIARGSSFETDFWLEVIIEVKPQHKLKLQEFLGINEEVTKMLTSMMKKLEIRTKNIQQATYNIVKTT